MATLTCARPQPRRWGCRGASDLARFKLRCTPRVEKFKRAPVFRHPFEIDRTIVAIRDARVLPEMELWLSQDASHAHTMRVADESGGDTMAGNREEPMAGSDALAGTGRPPD